MILLDDFVVIKMIDEPQGRIKLPDWQRTLRGEVVAVGPGKLLYSGARAPMECAVGDTVTFAATAGMDTSYRGKAVRLMHDYDVDVVLA
jgi:chaperonin GroES